MRIIADEIVCRVSAAHIVFPAGGEYPCGGILILVHKCHSDRSLVGQLPDNVDFLSRVQIYIARFPIRCITGDLTAAHRKFSLNDDTGLTVAGDLASMHFETGVWSNNDPRAGVAADAYAKKVGPTVLPPLCSHQLRFQSFYA